jgi:hypothetical protein
MPFSRRNRFSGFLFTSLLSIAFLFAAVPVFSQTPETDLRFEISFPESSSAKPLDGHIQRLGA